MSVGRSLSHASCELTIANSKEQASCPDLADSVLGFRRLGFRVLGFRGWGFGVTHVRSFTQEEHVFDGAVHARASRIQVQSRSVHTALVIKC